MDGTANPHLAFAAVATAGLLGLRRGGKLPPPIRGDPGMLTREERQQVRLFDTAVHFLRLSVCAGSACHIPSCCTTCLANPEV